MPSESTVIISVRGELSGWGMPVTRRDLNHPFSLSQDESQVRSSLSTLCDDGRDGKRTSSQRLVLSFQTLQSVLDFLALLLQSLLPLFLFLPESCRCCRVSAPFAMRDHVCRESTAAHEMLMPAAATYSSSIVIISSPTWTASIIIPSGPIILAFLPGGESSSSGVGAADW